MANSFENSVKKALDSLESIDVKIKGINTSLKAINDEAINKLKLIGKDVSGITDFLNKLKEQETIINKLKEKITSLTSEENKYQNSLLQLQTSLEKQKAAEEKVNAAREKRNQKTSELIVNQRALAKAADTEAIANSKLLVSYARLNAQREIAKEKLRDSTAEIKKAQREFDILNSKVNRANAATGNFAKGGLLNMVGGFKNLIGAFGIVGGIQLFADLARKAFDTARKLDSLNFALKSVTGSSVETLNAQRFLADIANKFGADIVTLTERYTKFFAATKETNLSLQQTNRIFEVFTKAAGVLGLRADELNGVFLALEQMISKNKVTTEELRRQLGERLPGAFPLMAKAIGVTTAQLDKMLRAGEILAEDALPKLANEVEKTLASFEGTQIETLAAKTARLENAFTRLVDVSKGAIAETVGGGQGLLTTLLNSFADIAENVKTESEGFTSFGDQLILLEDTITKFNPVADKELDELRDNIVKTAQEAKASAEDLQKFTNSIELLLSAGGGGKSIDVPTRLNFSVGGGVSKSDIDEKIRKEIEEQNKKASQRRVEILREVNLRIAKKGVRIINEKEFREDFLKELERVITNEPAEVKIPFTFLSETPSRTPEFLENEIKRINDLIQKTASNKEITELQKRRESLQKELDELLNVKPKGGKSGLEDFAKGSRAFLVSIISGLEKQRENLATTSNEWRLFTKQIEKAKDALDRFDAINNTENIKTTSKRFDLKSFDVNKLIPDDSILADAREKASAELQKFFDDIKKLNAEIFNLKKGIDDYFQSISEQSLSDLGFDSLKQVFDGSIKELFISIDKLKALGKIDEQEAGFKKFAAAFAVVGEAAKDAYNFIDQVQEQQFQNQLFRLDKEKEVALQFAGSSATARQKIEEDFDRKTRDLENKRAQQQKKKAVFDSIVNTAVGITAALAKANIPLAIAIGVLGALQTGFIASQKVPKFEKGTQNSPEGLALVDEKRPEVHTDKSGKVKSFGRNKANYRYLDKGDKIYPSFSDWADKTMQKSYNFTSDLSYERKESNFITKDDLDSVMSKHFSKIQVLEQNMNEKGFTNFVIGENARTELRNKRASMRGFKR